MIPGVGNGWYANVPLQPDAPSNVTPEFEDGGRVTPKAVSWLLPRTS